MRGEKSGENGEKYCMDTMYLTVSVCIFSSHELYHWQMHMCMYVVNIQLAYMYICTPVAARLLCV